MILIKNVQNVRPLVVQGLINNYAESHSPTKNILINPWLVCSTAPVTEAKEYLPKVTRFL